MYGGFDSSSQGGHTMISRAVIAAVFGLALATPSLAQALDLKDSIDSVLRDIKHDDSDLHRDKADLRTDIKDGAGAAAIHADKVDIHQDRVDLHRDIQDLRRDLNKEK
jgi:hypothetical protein